MTHYDSIPIRCPACNEPLCNVELVIYTGEPNNAGTLVNENEAFKQIESALTLHKLICSKIERRRGLTLLS